MKLPVSVLLLPVVAAIFSGCADALRAQESRANAVAEPSPAPVSSADLALTRLREGNRRYRTAEVLVVPGLASRRAQVAKGQHPSAVIVCCSDSRVPPELLFNATLGELFVVRTAGEVVSEVELGSVEYAVDHLDAKLVVVLGHSGCGAVNAACDSPHAHGHVNAVVEAIRPAVEATHDAAGNHAPAAIDANARLIAKRLVETAPLREELHAHRAKVVAARYDLDSGEVVWL